MATLKTHIYLRRGLAGALANVILAQGEPAFATDTGKLAIGDGRTPFKNLHNYYGPAEGELDDKYNEIISRGEQLVVNGNGFLGDNTNFSYLTFDGSQSNGSPGSFTYRKGGIITPKSDYHFPVNPNATYDFSVDYKSNGHPCAMYSFLSFFDADGKEITASFHMYVKNTLTQLARDLKPNDKVIYLDSAANWNVRNDTPGHQKSIIVWNYSNNFGYVYPPETYSRNYYKGLYEDNNAVNKQDNTITLSKPWSGPALPAGTYLSQGASGGTFKYGWIGKPGTNWETHANEFGKIDYSGQNKNGMFPPGTATVGVGFLWNYQGKDPEAQAWVTNISVREIRPRALNADHAVEADEAKHAASASNAGHAKEADHTLQADNSKLLNNQDGLYYLDYKNFNNTPVINKNISKDIAWQGTDYANQLIILHKVENNNSTIGSSFYVNGTLFLKRNNDIGVVNRIDFYSNKNFNSEVPNFHIKYTENTVNIRPCTVSYNNSKYFALDVSCPGANYSFAQFYGTWSDDTLFEQVIYAKHKFNEINNITEILNQTVKESIVYLTEGKGEILLGNFTADKITKAGGTSSQFLMADGSIKENSTLPVPTDYYWANVPISSTSSTKTEPTFQNVITDTIVTGDSDTSYFQTRRLRGEGSADVYYHAINFGYTNHNQIDFYEYGGKYNFWKNDIPGRINVDGDNSDKAKQNLVLGLTLSNIKHLSNTFNWPTEDGTLALLNNIGNGTITIKQTGRDDQIFTVNQSNDAIINLDNSTYDLSPYVKGPSSATDNAVAIWDNTTGKLLKNSKVSITGNNLDEVQAEKIHSKIFTSGNDDSSYFQAPKFRGQGDANNYKHAIDFGEIGHNSFDLFEYGGMLRLWHNTSDASVLTKEQMNSPQSSLYNDEETKTILRNNLVIGFDPSYIYHKDYKYSYPEKSGTVALIEDVSQKVENLYWADQKVTSSPDASKSPTVKDLTATRSIQTGDADDSYFQTRRLRGQGDAKSHQHAIDFGYSGHNQVDFYEYGAIWNFWKNQQQAASTTPSALILGITETQLKHKDKSYKYPEKSGTLALIEDIQSSVPNVTGKDVITVDKQESAVELGTHYEIKSEASLGGIKAGDSINGTLKDVLDKLLGSPTSFSISSVELNNTVRANRYSFEVGAEVNLTKLTANVHKGTASQLDKIKIIIPSYSQEFTPVKEGSNACVLNPTLPLTRKTSGSANVQAILYYNNSTATISPYFTYYFIFKFFYGSTTKDIDQLTESDIKAMSERLSSSYSSMTVRLNKNRSVLAVPTTASKQVIDENGYNVTGNFATRDISITNAYGIATTYRLYELKTAATGTKTYRLA